MKGKSARGIPQLIFLYLLITLTLIVIGFRLFQYQIIDSEIISEQADARIGRKIVLPAKRGMITDRDGNMFAYSLRMSNVYFDRELSEDSEADINKLYEAYPELSVVDTLEKINQTENGDTLIIEGLPYQYLRAVKTLGLAAIKVENINTRVYPNKTLAAHVLGFTGKDGNGLHGLEYTQEEYLTGKEGYIETRTDEFGRKLAYSEANIIEPIDGYTIETTLDQTIQHYVEIAIESGYKISNAQKVMAIVQDAKNGDILAMASFPNYDPNQYLMPIYDVQQKAIEGKNEEQTVASIMADYWSNPNTQAVYEPGSTFKIFTGAIGLEEGATSHNHSYRCIGKKEVTGKIIKCWNVLGHGNQDLLQGFQNSCNIVFMDIAEVLGKNTFYDYVKTFQLDQKSNIPLNGEANPLLTPLENLRPVDLARMSFGHNISLTPLQMMKVLGVVSNKGILTQPRLIKRILDAEGGVVEAFEPKIVGQIISENTADDVLSILETVITSGSGKKAYIPGYHIGGKTGTSIKLVNGRYDDDRIVYSSFAAIAPTDNPKFNLIVIVDEPKTENIHGSSVAAPIAKEILLNVLQYMQIKPENELGAEAFAAPAFIGMTLKEANALAASLNLTLVSSEETVKKNDETVLISKQYPLPGSLMSSYSEIFIKVERVVSSERESSGE